MLDLERILNQERLMRAMTGLNRNAFEDLLPSFTAADRQAALNLNAERKRAPGGGRKATLGTMEQTLGFIWVSCKCDPTFDWLSVLFDFDRSCAHAWVHRLWPILEAALGQRQVLPVRKIRSFEEFVERFPEVNAVILDGTERPVLRPQDPDKQKAHYSGKKKRHTRKHIPGTTRQKRVMILTQAREGRVQDKRQLDEELRVELIPPEIPIEVDLGFQGMQNEFENIHLPHKKPKGKAFTESQKQENRELSRQRVVCEHAHAGIKRYHSVSAVYRNRASDFDDRLMLVAAGLWNFYLDAA